MNVVKIAPEMGLKFAMNAQLLSSVTDDVGNVTPLQRFFCGAISGAVGQVQRPAIPQSMLCMPRPIARQKSPTVTGVCTHNLSHCPEHSVTGPLHVVLTVTILVGMV